MSNRQDSTSPKLCELSAQVLKLSKGKRRMMLKELGPSLINRFGDPTVGSHSLSLMDTITNKVGFAEYKYAPGWCHEPNPDDPLAVYRHGTAMLACDESLPRLEKMPLHGIFRRTHLTTGLQMQLQGDKKFPGTEKLLTPNLGNQEQQDALQFGVTMEVFSWKDFIENIDAFTALMASDNHDSDIVMGEDQSGLVIDLCLTMFDLCFTHLYFPTYVRLLLGLL